ncbi:MAG: hypothetical protein KGN84_05460 [Acidobacteriota bacterium]|nr:hypothetical protein [Acidobacteriota bacterium]
MKPFALIFLVCSAACAQDLTGKWHGFADTVDASGVKRRMEQTIEIKKDGKDYAAAQIGRNGKPIDLKMVADESGTKFTLLRDLDFEGGEHIRWHLELKDGHLTGTIWSVHDAPKKWGVDWSGPMDLTRAN